MPKPPFKNQFLLNKFLQAAAANKVDKMISLYRSKIVFKLGLKITNVNGNTALHQAAVNNCEAALRWLLEKGAKTTVRNLAGKTASDVAYSHGHFHLLTLLNPLSVEQKNNSAERREMSDEKREAKKVELCINLPETLQDRKIECDAIQSPLDSPDNAIVKTNHIISNPYANFCYFMAQWPLTFTRESRPVNQPQEAFSSQECKLKY